MLNDQIGQLTSQVKDKDQVLEFVEAEIQKIREKQDSDRMEMEAKDEMLTDERAANRDLSDQIQTKNDEIKVLIERMETYRRHKEGEVAKLKEEKNQTKEEIKVMIREHEKR